MISFKHGDLFTSGLSAFAHGCNCQGAMGKGIALQFKQKYPAMYAEYKKWCTTGRFKLGSLMIWYDDKTATTIFNLATQERWDRGGASLPALQSSLEGMCEYAVRFEVKDIGLPLIGAGLGGLSPYAVKNTLIDTSHEYPTVNLTVYQKD